MFMFMYFTKFLSYFKLLARISNKHYISQLHLYVHDRPPPVPVISQTNAVYSLTSNFVSVLILSSHPRPRPQTRLSPLIFSDKPLHIFLYILQPNLPT
jgi:hypothetical protein